MVCSGMPGSSGLEEGGSGSSRGPRRHNLQSRRHVTVWRVTVCVAARCCAPKRRGERASREGGRSSYSEVEWTLAMYRPHLGAKFQWPPLRRPPPGNSQHSPHHRLVLQVARADDRQLHSALPCRLSLQLSITKRCVARGPSHCMVPL